MKKQLSAFALGFAFLAPLAGSSQENRIQPCETYKAMEEVFASDPQARTRYEASQQQLRDELLNATRNAARTVAFQYTVPVVFQILHTYGGENITDAQCVSALAQMNSDLAKMGSDANTVAPPFGNLYIPSDIKLMLAHKDPNGNCTSGIVHRYDTRTVWDRNGDLNQLYNGIIWDPTKYLNIIIVKDIVPQPGQTGIVIGYTYKPGTWATGSNRDAIVYRYSNLGGLDARSLTHEFGHWVSLDHTFGPTNNPGVSCGDDGLNDTPPTKGNFSTCSSSASGNTCAGATTVYAAGQQNTENIMDYSSCPKNFTTDQTNAMRNALASTVSNRQNLWQPANLIATDVNGAGNCAPIADYYSANYTYTVCRGGSLNLRDNTYNTSTINYQWAVGPGGVLASPTSSNTTATFTTLGTTDVTLTVNNSQGTSTKVRTITVLDPTPGITGPVTESFEDNGVPANWNVINADANSAKWDQCFDAYYLGFASFFINGGNCGANQVDILETPIIDVAANQDKSFSFALSYRQASSTQNDQLKIQGSKDCGGSWSDITVLSGSNMQLNTGGIGAISFTPSVKEEWKVVTISGYPGWTNFVNSSSVKLRFTFVEGSTSFGNNLYIDAVNLFGVSDGVNELTKAYRLSLSPNPSNGEATLKFNLNDASRVKINVVDMLGKDALPVVENELPAGEQNVTLNSKATLAPGVYFVNLSVNGAKMSRKLVIN